MNKNEKECLINELNKTIEKIANNNAGLLNLKKGDNLIEWIELNLRLLNNQKIMIEQALINDFLEELV